MRPSIITKKPEKVRTHSRYQMRKRETKSYVKCQCGAPRILVSTEMRACKVCGARYESTWNSFSQPHGQSLPWPKRLTYKRKGYDIAAERTMHNSFFNLGRHTKKLLKQIEAAADTGRDEYVNISLDYELCVDGRKRISCIWAEFRFFKPNITFETRLYFNIHPELRNNRIVNEKLKGMLDDIMDAKKAIKSNTKVTAERAYSEERVILETGMKYEY